MYNVIDMSVLFIAQNSENNISRQDFMENSYPHTRTETGAIRGDVSFTCICQPLLDMGYDVPSHHTNIEMDV